MYQKCSLQELHADSARLRHTALAPLYLLYPSRFLEAQAASGLPKFICLYRRAFPPGWDQQHWVGSHPWMLSRNRNTESEISTSSRWQLNTPSTLAWVDGKLPRVPQTKSRPAGGGSLWSQAHPICWKHTEQNGQGTECGIVSKVSTVPSQHAPSR